MLIIVAAKAFAFEFAIRGLLSPVSLLFFHFAYKDFAWHRLLNCDNKKWEKIWCSNYWFVRIDYIHTIVKWTIFEWDFSIKRSGVPFIILLLVNLLVVFESRTVVSQLICLQRHKIISLFNREGVLCFHCFCHINRTFKSTKSMPCMNQCVPSWTASILPSVVRQMESSKKE